MNRRNQTRARAGETDASDAGHARARGAQSVTLRYRPEGAAHVQSHAAWRLPGGHADSHLVDRLHACGQLNDRHHANAVALLALWRAAGQDTAVTATYGPMVAKGRSLDSDAPTPEDEWRQLLRETPAQPMALLCDMLRGQHPGVRWLATVQAALDRLDYLCKRWDATMWSDDA